MMALKERRRKKRMSVVSKIYLIIRLKGITLKVKSLLLGSAVVSTDFKRAIHSGLPDVHTSDRTTTQ